MDYLHKYLKYKSKYLQLSTQLFGGKKKIKKGKNKTKMIDSANNSIDSKELHECVQINKEISKIIFDSNALPIYNIDDLPTTLKYNLDKFKNMNCHVGQRKTLLTEFEFYNKCVDFDEKNNLIIYAGAAASEKLPILLKLFPTLKFLLIDPNYFSINWDLRYVYQNVDNIDKDHHKYFTEILKTKKAHSQFLVEIAKLSFKTKFLYDDENTYNIFDIYDDGYKDKMDIFKKKFESKKINIIDEIFTSDTQVFIIQDYMTIELTDLLKQYIDNAKTKHKLYFLSDIRTNEIAGTETTDIDILWNSALQIVFVKGLNPEFSMLKYRTPFYMKDDPTPEIINKRDKKYDFVFETIDYVKKYYDVDLIKYYKKKEFLYFASDFIYVQPWAPSGSSETRMFVSKQNSNKEFIPYDLKHEDRMYFYKFIRFFKFYPFFYEKLKDVPELHYDGCQDCTREIMIVMDYIMKEQSYRYNITKIVHELDKKSVVDQLIDINKLIKQYTYFDLSKENYKCPHKFGNGHGNKTRFHKFNPFIIGKEIYKLDKHSKLVTSN